MESPHKGTAPAPGTSIVLIGMMGAGKSSVGAILSQRTGMRCCDIDHCVEERAGRAVVEIFAHGGEESFRELESEILAELPRLAGDIVVTGGGIVLRASNRLRLKELGTVVWLDAEEEVLFERATRDRDRPLLNVKNPRAVFAELYQKRQSLYAETADLRIDTSTSSAAAVADQIAACINQSES